MEIFTFLGILAGFSAIIMPWVTFLKVRKLQRKVSHLRKIIENPLLRTNSEDAKDNFVKTVNNTNSEKTKFSEESLEKNNCKNEGEATSASSRTIWFDEKITKKDDFPEISTIEASAASSASEDKIKNKIGIEQQLGTRLPVWIGGIAMALSGLFLIKYSIENNLISPSVRVVFGAIFGFAMLYSSKWIRNKPNFANGERISQSLAGSGIAVLYLASFASSRLYDLVPNFVGFMAMAAVTASALILSLKNGPAIALMGMVGGFLTPTLLNTESGNAFSLFIYLYFTASGLLIVVRKTSWWWMSIPTIIISFLWVVIWLFSNQYVPADNLYLILFLIGISISVIISSKQKYEESYAEVNSGIFKMTSILNYIGLGGTILITGFITTKSSFEIIEWSLFGLLSLAGIGLAYFNGKLYGFVPLLSMAVNVVMLFYWKTSNNIILPIVIESFAVIYIFSSYYLIQKSRNHILWAGTLGSSLLSYYFLSYAKLHKIYYSSNQNIFWGLVAFLLAIIATRIVQWSIAKIDKDYPYKEHVIAIFTIVCTAFISTGLFIELNKEFLSVAIATQILAMSWINSKISIKILEPLILLVACIFALLLLPQIILLLQLTSYSIIEAQMNIQTSVPIVNWPIFQLGLPAIMFLTSSFLLSKKNNSISYKFDISAISLLTIMGYYITRNIMHPEQNILFVKVGFLERGIITNIIFLYGLGCFWFGKKFKRSSFSSSAIILCAIAIFRVVYFDIFIYNPFQTISVIQGIAIFNTLFITYGLPLIWCHFSKKELIYLNKEQLTKYTNGFMLLSIFTLITLNIHYLFADDISSSEIITNAEIYSYSIAWLIIGISLLFVGLIRNDKMMRYASLGMMVVVVGKVFLYDASELDGLYRVFSFLGLGLSLIGLSYIYTRFVFKEQKTNEGNSKNLSSETSTKS